MNVKSENRPDPRTEADHVIYRIVLPVWNKLYSHDFWADGYFDAFYEAPEDGPAVSVCISRNYVEIQYNEYHLFCLADPDCIHEAQQKLIEIFGTSP